MYINIRNSHQGGWISSRECCNMADADEDVIPRSGPSAEQVDLSDETQDFRFLTSLS